MCTLIVFDLNVLSNSSNLYLLIIQKIDLSIQPIALGFQTFLVNIQFECKEKSYLKNDNKITVCMNVITCALKISRITNDSIPYFGKLTMNKLFNCIK